MAAVAQRKAEQDRDIKQVASSQQAPVEQIAGSQALLASGTVTQAVFDTLKTKALAWAAPPSSPPPGDAVVPDS